MPITDKKISASEYTGNDISGLSNTPSADGVGATTLKARFDALFKVVFIPKWNSFIDMLVSTNAGTSGARQIGMESTTGFPYSTVYDGLVGLDTVKVSTTELNAILLNLVYASPTPPADPYEGQLWLDTSGN